MGKKKCPQVKTKKRIKGGLYSEKNIMKDETDEVLQIKEPSRNIIIKCKL